MLAGLGVTVLTHDELEPGMKAVGGQFGLPSLPKADFVLAWSAGGKTAASLEFGQLLASMSESPRRGTKLVKPRAKQIRA